MFLDFFKAIVLALRVFAFVRKWLLLFVDAVFNLILLFNCFRSSAKIWESITKSFSEAKLVLCADFYFSLVCDLC